MAKPKKKKKLDKPAIVRLIEGLEYLFDETNCDALADVHVRIEHAKDDADRVYQELADLRCAKENHDRVWDALNDLVTKFDMLNKETERDTKEFLGPRSQ